MRGVGFVIVLVAGTLLLVWFFLIRSPQEIPGMVPIPVGPFLMGSDEVDQKGRAAEFGLHKPLYLDEHPSRIVSLLLYYIDRYEVTNAQYLLFVQNQQRRSPSHWQNEQIPNGQEHFPAVNVNWYEANDYCGWVGKRLPTEAEWEKAGRGARGNTYPWGDIFDASYGNVGQTGQGAPVRIGSFPQDKSVYGVYDLAGNIMEWTADWYVSYPGSDHQSPLFGEAYKVARGDAFGGGGHYYLDVFTRLSYRQQVLPKIRYDFLGFRCAKDG